MIKQLEENILIAYVVSKNNIKEDILVTKLKVLCNRYLNVYEIPKIFQIVESLPKTNNGKLKRGI